MFTSFVLFEINVYTFYSFRIGLSLPAKNNNNQVYSKSCTSHGVIITIHKSSTRFFSSFWMKSHPKQTQSLMGYKRAYIWSDISQRPNCIILMHFLFWWVHTLLAHNFACQIKFNANVKFSVTQNISILQILIWHNLTWCDWSWSTIGIDFWIFKIEILLIAIVLNRFIWNSCLFLFLAGNTLIYWINKMIYRKLQKIKIIVSDIYFWFNVRIQLTISILRHSQ